MCIRDSPEGATPKDGPSAGIGMVTSIISAITEIPVDKKVAMTGEITLRGIVLPIGGLKEKLLAAHRAGIKKVIIPMENKKDLVEVPKTILETMEIIPVKNVDEVLKVALIKPLKRVEWVEVDQISEKNKIKLINVDQLKVRAEENLQARGEEIKRCLDIIDRQILKYYIAEKERNLVRALSSVPKSIKGIRQKAFREVFVKELEALDPGAIEVVNSLVDYIEKKYISVPMKMAKEILLKETTK